MLNEGTVGWREGGGNMNEEGASMVVNVGILRLEMGWDYSRRLSSSTMKGSG